MTPSDIRSQLSRGILRAVPMMLGYIPLGFAFGVLALGTGLAPANMLLMSLIVYGGSSQVLAVQMMGVGAEPVAIVATTFVVNLRHLLMASALAPHLRRFSRGQLMAFALSLCDEAFALHSTRFSTGSPGHWETFAVNISLHVVWMVGSALALLVPSDASFLHRYGLDFAPCSMFIALLVLMVKTRRQAAVVALCGTLAVLLQLLGAGTWSVLGATVVGASFGLWSERWTSKKSF